MLTGGVNRGLPGIILFHQIQTVGVNQIETVGSNQIINVGSVQVETIGGPDRR